MPAGELVRYSSTSSNVTTTIVSKITEPTTSTNKCTIGGGANYKRNQQGPCRICHMHVTISLKGSQSVRERITLHN